MSSENEQVGKRDSVFTYTHQHAHTHPPVCAPHRERVVAVRVNIYNVARTKCLNLTVAEIEVSQRCAPAQFSRRVHGWRTRACRSVLHLLLYNCCVDMKS